MSNAMIALYQPAQWLFAVACLIVGSGCASNRIALDTDFPVPLVAPSSARVAIVISPELQSFVHNEKIAKRGDYSINVGAVQKRLFNRLAQGAFNAHIFTDTIAATTYDGLLVPNIAELQFATPAQSRTDYYEVWMRYRFDLYDSDAVLLGSWDLPAYGKANQTNYNNDTQGLYAAALAACRDMAAMFSLNFSTAQPVQSWLSPAADAAPANSDEGATQ